MALHAERCKVREMPRQEWRLSYLRKALIKTALLSLGDVNRLFYRQKFLVKATVFQRMLRSRLVDDCNKVATLSH